MLWHVDAFSAVFCSSRLDFDFDFGSIRKNIFNAELSQRVLRWNITGLGAALNSFPKPAERVSIVDGRPCSIGINCSLPH